MQKAIIKHISNKIVNHKKSVYDVNRWLYHHGSFLSHFNIITNIRAKEELTSVADRYIDHNQFDKAISTVCKLHDLRFRLFLDMNNYEPITFSGIKHRIIRYQHKIQNLGHSKNN